MSLGAVNQRPCHGCSWPINAEGRGETVPVAPPLSPLSLSSGAPRQNCRQLGPYARPALSSDWSTSPGSHLSTCAHLASSLPSPRVPAPTHLCPSAWRLPSLPNSADFSDTCSRPPGGPFRATCLRVVCAKLASLVLQLRLACRLGLCCAHSTRTHTHSFCLSFCHTNRYTHGHTHRTGQKYTVVCVFFAALP